MDTFDFDLSPLKISPSKLLASCQNTILELSRVPFVDQKYEKSALERPIHRFLEFAVEGIPDPSLPQRSFDFWWERFVSFLKTQKSRFDFMSAW